MTRWWQGVSLGAAGALGNFGFSAIGPAMPAIDRAFGVGAGTGAWVLVGYSLGVGVSVSAGRVADRSGTRPAIAAAAVALALGSLGAAAAPSFVALVMARVVQSFGASALSVMCAVTITARVRPSDRTAALAAYTAASSVTIGVGPLVGAVVAGALGWRVVLLLPLVALAGAVLLWCSPVARGAAASRDLDLLTSVLTLAGVTALLLTLTSGATSLSPALTLVLALVTVAVTLALAVRSRRGLSATLPASVAANRALWWLMVGSGSVFAVYLGEAYLLPFTVPSGTGVVAGLPWLPAAGCAVAAVAAATACAPSTPRRLLVVGSAATAGGLLLAVAGALTPARAVGLCLVVSAWATTQLFGLEWVPRLVAVSERGVALGLFNFVFVAAGSLGPAIGGVVLQPGGVVLASGVVGVLGLIPVLASVGLAREARRARRQPLRASLPGACVGAAFHGAEPAVDSLCTRIYLLAEERTAPAE